MGRKKLEKANLANMDENKPKNVCVFTDEEAIEILDEYDRTGNVSNPKFNSYIDGVDTTGIAKQILTTCIRDYIFKEELRDMYRVLDAPDSILELTAYNNEESASIRFNNVYKDKAKSDINEYLQGKGFMRIDMKYLPKE